MAYARRKFFDLRQSSKSGLAGRALELNAELYAVEREIQGASAEHRVAQRQGRSKAIAAQTLHGWLVAQRARVTDGTATAKAIDYSLGRWKALKVYIDDQRLPIDNNHDEQQIRPWATGRKNGLRRSRA